MLADNVGILSGARIDASGDTGGGTIRIGGDFHGAGTTPTALRTIVVGNTLILANAVTSGNGGHVTVWADDWTNYAGSIEAKGGAFSGNGGYVETSGRQALAMNGSVNASAAHGNAGTWLLDPNDVTISNTATTNAGAAPSFSDSGSPANVYTGDIVTALNGGTSVTVTASGSITLSSPIAESTYNGTESLTLAAGSDITIGSTITASGNTKLNVTLDADTANGGGSIVLNSGSSIISNGGNIVLGGGAAPSMDSAVGDNNAENGIYLNASTLNAGGGNITMTGTGYSSGALSGSSGVVMSGSTVETSNSGTITIAGVSGSTTGAYDYGVQLLNSGVTTQNGDIAIAGISVASGSSGVGIVVQGGQAYTTGSGNITLTAIGSTGQGIAFDEHVTSWRRQRRRQYHFQVGFFIIFQLYCADDRQCHFRAL